MMKQFVLFTSDKLLLLFILNLLVDVSNFQKLNFQKYNRVYQKY